MSSESPTAFPLTAPAEAGGVRLDKWLAENGAGMSRSRLRLLIEEGRLTVNGKVEADPSAKMIPDAVYDLALPEPTLADPSPRTSRSTSCSRTSI
jgi:23S rRNA pseudouridine1911/1915/1917 synthase